MVLLTTGPHIGPQARRMFCEKVPKTAHYKVTLSRNRKNDENCGFLRAHSGRAGGELPLARCPWLPGVAFERSRVYPRGCEMKREAEHRRAVCVEFFVHPPARRSVAEPDPLPVPRRGLSPGDVRGRGPVPLGLRDADRHAGVRRPAWGRRRGHRGARGLWALGQLSGQTHGCVECSEITTIKLRAYLGS